MKIGVSLICGTAALYIAAAIAFAPVPKPAPEPAPESAAAALVGSISAQMESAGCDMKQTGAAEFELVSCSSEKGE